MIQNVRNKWMITLQESGKIRMHAAYMAPIRIAHRAATSKRCRISAVARAIGF